MRSAQRARGTGPRGGQGLGSIQRKLVLAAATAAVFGPALAVRADAFTYQPAASGNWDTTAELLPGWADQTIPGLTTSRPPAASDIQLWQLGAVGVTGRTITLNAAYAAGNGLNTLTIDSANLLQQISGTSAL